ncbi:MAG: hypothetical protein NT077_03445 [Candidatus Taylorbacteria bacterium]|nr:hypothetical protein [Candidatus Taylorbacteria bacterium]
MAVYPHKQTVVILVVCILVVGGMAFYVRGGISGVSNSKLNGINNSNNLSISSQQVLPVTTDWRKQFLGNSATSTNFKTTSKTTLAKDTENLTSTDLLGRAIFSKYAELRQTGLNNDSKTVDSVVSQVTTSNLAALPTPKTFSKTDIRTSASSKTALAIYARAIILLFQTYMPKTNEMEVANQAFADNDMLKLKNIDPIIDSYKKMISILTATPVPEPIAGYHIDLLNGISMALYNAESFRHADVDPVRGVTAVSLELVALQNISSALSNMHRYFTSVGVQLSS